MSYTNKKVIWEKCAGGSSDTNTYLLDENGNFLTGVDLSVLVVESNPIVNEYGDSIMNEYNDIQRPEVTNILARKQPHEDVLKTADGKEILTKSYFYVDPKIEPRALEIKYMDKLDGELVMQKYVMCDLHNKPKMVRFITV